jgi:hypothetical protein
VDTDATGEGEMDAAELLIQDLSPNGNIEACVEQDPRVVYFYLQGAAETEFGVRSCWVRNLQPAPATLDVDGMRTGAAPMLPAGYCAHPAGAAGFSGEDLRVVWFEEGDAAALLSGREVLAIIPSWSGSGGFHGYARDCTGESPLCWPLGTPEDNVLFQRISRAEEFWASWDSPSSPWPPLRDSFCAALAQQIGPYEKYYAIDGDRWPPKAMLRIPVPSAVALVTLGVSIRPQPKVEMYTREPGLYRRIELGLCLSAEFPDTVIDAASRYVSAQTNLPWNRYTWFKL